MITRSSNAVDVFDRIAHFNGHQFRRLFIRAICKTRYSLLASRTLPCSVIMNIAFHSAENSVLELNGDIFDTADNVCASWKLAADEWNGPGHRWIKHRDMKFNLWQILHVALLAGFINFDRTNYFDRINAPSCCAARMLWNVIYHWRIQIED